MDRMSIHFCNFFPPLPPHAHTHTALFGMVGWAVFMDTFESEGELEAFAALYWGRSTPGRATVYTLVAWLLSVYAGVAAYFAENPLPPPPPPPPRRVKLADNAAI